MHITEIYRSIQGESSYAGLASIFVRLAGCNLCCSYCDSIYAKQPGYQLNQTELYQRIKKYHCRLVLITGGEPLLQAKELIPFCRFLLQKEYRVLLETNGSLDISELPPGVIRIMDLKCPDSGEHKRMRWENINHLTPIDQLKFVLCSRGDYEWAREIIIKYDLKGEILMGVAYGRLEPRELVGWLLEDNLPVRFQLQLHKYIWPPETRGV
jgi:7-carboxy-7-deazaguanine synthase